MIFSRKKDTETTNQKLEKLKKEIETADAILIGAGSGLSTAAGYTYSGERFDRYFSDFAEKFGIRDMYSGGFYPFPNMETYWAWWARHIYVNRYDQPENEVYQNLLKLVKDKNYFVLTTNVDHQFQLAGFDKKRLFYMQGDYGLWQCTDPCHQVTYDNEAQVREMLVATNFLIEKDGRYEIDLENKANSPERAEGSSGGASRSWKMEIPTELIPYCPDCNEPMNMNLRCDDTFVQDDGWYAAKNRYDDFVRRYENSHILYLELGVGMNTPVWIKYPFWKKTNSNKEAVYACLNYGEAYAPGEIADRSICLDGDISYAFKKLN